LENSAVGRLTRRKILRFVAGTLALLSGASITAVIVAFVNDSRALKILSAALAFTSGLISLLLDGFYDPQETQHMFAGANEFMILRNKLDIERTRPNLTDVRAHETLKKLTDEYGAACKKYDPLISQRLIGFHIPIISHSP
jgi:hypothetical protein